MDVHRALGPSGRAGGEPDDVGIVATGNGFRSLKVQRGEILDDLQMHPRRQWEICSGDHLAGRRDHDHALDPMLACEQIRQQPEVFGTQDDRLATDIVQLIRDFGRNESCVAGNLDEPGPRTAEVDGDGFAGVDGQHADARPFLGPKVSEHACQGRSCLVDLLQGPRAVAVDDRGGVGLVARTPTQDLVDSAEMIKTRGHVPPECQLPNNRERMFDYPGTPSKPAALPRMT